MMTDNQWTTEYPKRVGNYWFYGWASAHSRDSLRVKPFYRWVKVRQTRNSLMYCTDAEILFPASNPMMGLWKKFDLPDIPDDFEERVRND